MASTLRSTLDELANSFADGVLAAIRTASLEDLRAEAGARPARGGGGRPDPVGRGGARRSGRLPRRSQEEIGKALDRVVATVKASKGMRAEEIKAALKLDRRELPRVLHEGLKKKVLRATGQKRATTYFAGVGRPVAPKAKPRAARKTPKGGQK